jgi:predicted amidohydrolase YtcJ
MKISHQNLILVNGNIITLDPFCPQAAWAVIKNEKIVTTGNGKDWKNYKNKNSTIIDCSGQTVIPGLIDAHLHLVSYAKSFVTADISPGKNVHSILDIQTIIKNFSGNRPSGQWIFGRGYNDFYLAEKRHPNRWDLDKATPDHPVRLTHRSGHVHVLNSLALKFVGITRETGDPDGGLIERDLKTGDPTGLLYEMGDFLYDRIPPLTPAELERGLQLVDQKLVSLGVTSIQDASSRNDTEHWKLVKSWKESGSLHPRVNLMLGFSAFQKKDENYPLSGLNQNQLRMGAVKIILDDTTGRLHPAQSELNAMVLEVHQAGQQIAIHARPPDLARTIASLGITVVTQPAFIYFHGERYLATVPDERLKHLYPLKTLLDQGINVAASSDCPIVSPDPLVGINAAIHRLSAAGDTVSGEQRIQPGTALRMYTLNAARAAFEETVKGSVTPGKLADLVVLNADPTRLTAEEFKSLQVEMTIIGGEVVWQKKR